MVAGVWVVVFLVALAGQSCFSAFSSSLCTTSTICWGQQQSTELPMVLLSPVGYCFCMRTLVISVFSVLSPIKSCRLCQVCMAGQDRKWHKKVHCSGELWAAASVRTANKHVKRNGKHFKRENIHMESYCFSTLLGYECVSRVSSTGWNPAINGAHLPPVCVCVCVHLKVLCQLL